MDASIFDHLDRARRIAEREYEQNRNMYALEVVMAIKLAIRDAEQYQEGKRG